MTLHRPFEIGVAYWPVRQALRMWRDFDEGEIREDFHRLQELGLSPVRIFLLWEDFQPDRDEIDLRALRHLDRLCTCAANCGRRLWLTLFAGHLHRANWLPGWMVGSETTGCPYPTLAHGLVVPFRARNWTADAGLLAAQRLQLREILAVVRGHPSRFVIDLGERPSAIRPDLEADAVRRWLGELSGDVRREDPTLEITVGLQPSDLLASNGLSPERIAEACSLISLSVFPDDLAGCTDPSTSQALAVNDPTLPLFLAELTRNLAGCTKPVWLSGLGLPTTRTPQKPANAGSKAGLVPEGRVEEFARRCLGGLARYGIPGALWWTFADPWPSHWRHPPFADAPEQRSFGLVRDDGSSKPTLSGLQAVDRQDHGDPPDSFWFDCEPEQYWRSPMMEFYRLLRRFREEIHLPP